LAAFSHSTFDVGRSMFDVHLGSGLFGLGINKSLEFVPCFRLGLVDQIEQNRSTELTPKPQA